jgi:predicted RNA-binding protein (virulence factor B family)
MPRAPSPYGHLLGRVANLRIRRFAQAGAFLCEAGSKPDSAGLLLLGHEIPPGAREGDELSVFVYADSEGRPLATTAAPRLTLDEVAFLEVTASTEFGAFVDWGMPKELLVPFAQQTGEPRVGSLQPIGLYLDGTGRLAGTMRVSELLAHGGAEFELDEWIAGEAWRMDPEIGLFVIVERRFVGLVPRAEPHNLSRGQAASFRVSHVQPDGKLELSLRGHAHEELENDAQHILRVLALPETARYGDRSSPEQIRRQFGLSKKAFKRGVGRLLKQGLVELDGEGCVRLLR